MTHAPLASDPVPHPDRAVFEACWSQAKLHRCAIVLAAALLPLAAAEFTGPPVLQAIALALTSLLLFPARGLARRAADPTPVIALDRLGVLDRRIRVERIYWSDIATFCPVNLGRAKVVDAYLCQPRLSRPDLAPATRLGRTLQEGFGVPAITFSFLLLDRSAAEFAAVVARLHPGLWPARQPLPGRLEPSPAPTNQGRAT